MIICSNGNQIIGKPSEGGPMGDQVALVTVIRKSSTLNRGSILRGEKRLHNFY